MKTGVISLTREQHVKLDVINKAIAGFITVKEASEKLGKSERQIQRLKKEVRENGPAALIHKNTERKPTNTISKEVKAKILKIRETSGYSNSNFQHFNELLETKHGITISYSCLYRLLKSENIISPKKRRRFKPHKRRKRRPQAGELIQMDASPHFWLDNETMTELHGGIDDATGQVVGLYLCKNECMLGYHEVMRRMIGTYGIPEAVYADRHTIFRSPIADKANETEYKKGTKVHETQFGRALSELGIQIIAARSPQAKGRIERLWGTLQSRLPVEFAINNITDMDAANKFLESYIFAFNSEFAIEPEDCDSTFLPLDESKELDHILCIKETRLVDNGQVFSYQGKLLQICDCEYASYIPSKAKITVMASPHIGIKAAYKNYIFEVSSVAKRTKNNNTGMISPAPIKTEKGNPWEPKDGMPWQPGLPTYNECMDMLQEIFLKPYVKKKKSIG